MHRVPLRAVVEANKLVGYRTGDGSPGAKTGAWVEIAIGCTTLLASVISAISSAESRTILAGFASPSSGIRTLRGVSLEQFRVEQTPQ